MSKQIIFKKKFIYSETDGNVTVSADGIKIGFSKYLSSKEVRDYIKNRRDEITYIKRDILIAERAIEVFNKEFSTNEM